jgi:hypothetical protein
MFDIVTNVTARKIILDRTDQAFLVGHEKARPVVSLTSWVRLVAEAFGSSRL